MKVPKIDSNYPRAGCFFFFSFLIFLRVVCELFIYLFSSFYWLRAVQGGELKEAKLFKLGELSFFFFRYRPG